MRRRYSALSVNAIQWINPCPLDNSIGFAGVYPVDSAIHLLNNPGQSVIFEQRMLMNSKLLRLCLCLVRFSARLSRGVSSSLARAFIFYTLVCFLPKLGTTRSL